MADAAPAIEILPARNGQVTARVRWGDGRFSWLHSAYDPGREAASLVAKHALDHAGVVVVLGLGLGYHVAELLQQLDNQARVLVIESDDRMIKLARKHNRSITWKRITIAAREEEIKAFFFQHRDVLREKKLVLIDHPASVRTNPDYYTKIRQHIRDYVSTLLVETATGKVINRSVHENMLANLPGVITDPGVHTIADIFRGCPAVIVSAGPSLSNNMRLLNQAKNKGVIICVGTALKAMLAEGLHPDLVVTLDPNIGNYKLFEGLDPTEAFLCYEPQTHRLIPPLFAGRRFVFNSFQSPLANWLVGLYGAKGYIEPGGSVAVAAFGIAYLLGSDPIVFIGQDLAYTGGFTHAKGTVYEGRQVKPKAGRLDYLEVPAIGGGKVWTSRAMHSVLVRFEELFAKYSDRLIIDATEGGALKQGTKVMTFREALDTYFTKEVPALEIITTKHREASGPRPDVVRRVRKELENTLEAYRKWLPKLDQLLEKAQGIVKAADVFNVAPDAETANRFAQGAARHLQEQAAELNALLKEVNTAAKLIDLLSLLTFEHHLAKTPPDGATLLDQVRHIIKLYEGYRTGTKTMISQLEQTLVALDDRPQEQSFQTPVGS
ncbi:MAG: motility associated factor glycosyltransferase family protein [Peptococcaceae bacterium]|nr:motility associated factor glycosyltransferase family protein [Peptococcaceae bacterium]